MLVKAQITAHKPLCANTLIEFKCQQSTSDSPDHAFFIPSVHQDVWTNPEKRELIKDRYQKLFNICWAST